MRENIFVMFTTGIPKRKEKRGKVVIVNVEEKTEKVFIFVHITVTSLRLVGRPRKECVLRPQQVHT